MSHFPMLICSLHVNDVRMDFQHHFHSHLAFPSHSWTDTLILLFNIILSYHNIHWHECLTKVQGLRIDSYPTGIVKSNIRMEITKEISANKRPKTLQSRDYHHGQPGEFYQKI